MGLCISFDSIQGRTLLLETGNRLRVEGSVANPPVAQSPAGAQEKAIPLRKVQIS
jgi:hypothetical protein